MIGKMVKAVAGVLESPVSSVAVGIGAALVAPLVVRQMRPLAKKAIKEGIRVSEKAREMVAEARESWSDLVAEVRSELTAAPASPEGAAGTAPPPPEAAASE